MQNKAIERITNLAGYTFLILLLLVGFLILFV